VAKNSASLQDVAANDAVRLSNAAVSSGDGLPVKIRNDTEAIPSSIEKV
jgi:hypothetical protein